MENYNNDKDQNRNEDFGLPEHAFQPIERKETEMGNVNKPENKPFDQEKKTSYNWPVIIALLIILGLSVFIIYWFTMRNEPEVKVADYATVEETTTDSVSDYYAEESEWSTGEEKVEEPVVEESPVEEPVAVEAKVGSITEVTNRTGLSYIVVGSFFDEDLANDRAKELKKEGYEVYVLHPTEKKRFFRVAVNSFNTYAEGVTAAESLKSKFGEEVWVLRY